MPIKTYADQNGITGLNASTLALEQTLPHIDQDQLEAAIAVVEYAVASTERLLDLRAAQSKP